MLLHRYSRMLLAPWLASFIFVLLHGSDSAIIGSPSSAGGLYAGQGNVRFVQAVFRHGERTPADTYPLDPHINHTFYPEGWGHLTMRGKRQQLEQGRFLRSRYSSLVGDVYTASAAEAHSTDVDRSLMSATLVLAGLFPPGPSQELEPGLEWQPVPVHTVPLSHDRLLLVRVTCPRYHEQRNRALSSPPASDLLERNADLLRQLSEHTGESVRTLDDVQSLYSTLLAEERYNLTLPEWTRGIYPDRLINMTSYSFLVNVLTPSMQRLKAGPLLNAIVGAMERRSRGETLAKRIVLYSGHDSTVANLLVALGLFQPPYIPGYNALLLFELTEPTPQHFAVRIFRRTEEIHEPELMKIPGCAEECPLDEFLRITAPLRPFRWEAECMAEDPNFVPPTPSPP